MFRRVTVLAASVSMVTAALVVAPAAIAASGVPGVPVVLSVVPSSSGAVVGVRVPSTGGVASSVSVVSSPGGVSASTNTVSAAGDAFVSVSGLSAGTGYSFTATASNASGSSGVSAASAVVTPNTADGAGDFVPVGPVRSYNFRDAGSSALAAGESRNIQVAGVAGVPSSGVAAVALAVSVVNPSAAGFVTVWPAGAPRPQATTVNFSAGLTKTDLTKVPLGAGGQVSIYNYAGTTGFTFDVVGFYEDSSGTFTHNVSFAPIAPYRVFDSRPGHGGVGGEQGGSGPLAAGSVTKVQVIGGVAGGDGVPAGASAVEVNVEAVNPASAGYGTLWADGSPQPRVSNILYGTGAAGTIVTSAITPVGADGAISVFVNTSSDVVIDISGYYAPSATGRFTPITPTRAYDSRCGTGNPLGAGASRTVTVAGGPAGDSTSPVPATATAVVFAATAVDNTTASYLTFWPGGQTQPHAANLLPTAPGTLTDNLVVTGLGANAVSVYNNTGSTDVVADINGYYQPAGDPTPTPPAAVGCPRALTTTPTATSITLNWHNPAVVTGYTLVRKPGPTPPASPTDGTVLTTTLTGTATSYTDTGLTPATQYSYALYATGPTNNYSQPGTITTTTTTPTAPGPVTAVTATPASTSVALSWTNPTGANFAGVMIRRAAGATAPASPTDGTLVTDTTGTTPAYTDTGLTPATQYSYALFAHDNNTPPDYATGTNTTTTTTAATGSASISGTVTAASNGVGLVGVTVTVFAETSGKKLTSTSTAANGTYTVANLAAGAYDVCFDGAGVTTGPSSTGYQRQCWKGVAWDGGPVVPFGATAVTVSTAAVGGIGAALTSAGKITGTVTAASGGAPLAGVTLFVFDTTYGDLATGFGQAVTGSDGTYSLSGVTPSASGYTICFDASKATGGTAPAGYLDQCYKNVPWSGVAIEPASGTTPVPVAIGTVASGVDAALPSAAGISGTVTGAGGGGLKGVTVLVYDVATGYQLSTGFSTATTAADGSYTVKNLSPASSGFNVCFDASGASGGTSSTGYLDQCYNNVAWDGISAVPAAASPVSVTAGAVTTGKNAVLAVGSAISGTVSASGGGGLGNVAVDVYNSSGTYVTGAVTAASGAYTVGGLAVSAAGYVVCFDPSHATGGTALAGYQGQCWKNAAWQPGNAPAASATLVPTTAGTTASDVNATLSTAGGISGTVTAASGGAALQGVSVSVYDSNGYQVGSPVTTAANGTYTISLAAGGYKVCFAAGQAVGGSSSTGYVDQCYAGIAWDGSGQPAAGAQTVSVAAGSIHAGVDAALAAAGGIGGTITAAGSAAALAGVRVDVYDSGQNFAGTAVSAGDGTYQVGSLAASATGYTVCFDATNASGGSSSTGYLDQCYRDVAWDGGAVPGGTTPIPVTAGSLATADAVLAAAPAPGAISGAVTAATGGAALGGVSVLAFTVASGGTASAVSTATTTGSDGSYTLTGLSPGSYDVCFDATTATGGSSAGGYLDQCYSGATWDGYSVDITGATAVSVTSGATHTGITAALATAGTISGSVTAASGGAALPGAWVFLYDSSGNQTSFTRTGGGGSYRFPGVTPSAAGYFVCFGAEAVTSASSYGYADQCYNGVPWQLNAPLPAAASAIPVAAGQLVSGVNAALSDEGAITGRVADSAGAGIGNVQIDVYDAGGNRDYNVYASTVANGTDTGNFEIDGLSPSATGYTLCFDASGASGGSSSTGYLSQCYRSQPWDGFSAPPAGTTAVPVTAGTATSGIDVTLNPGGAISGTTSDSASKVNGVAVEVYTPAGARVRWTQTLFNGTYSVVGLQSGPYLVCFDAGSAVGASSTGYLDQCYSGKAWDGQATPTTTSATSVPVNAGSTTANVNATLAVAGQVTGVVRDASGPVSDVSVVVYDTSGNPLANLEGSSAYDGSYTIAQLPTGTYQICFAATNGSGASTTGYLDQCYNGANWDGTTPTGSTVSVTQGSVTTGIDATLAPGGAISGTTTDAAGPVGSVWVDLYDSSGRYSYNNDYYTGSDGTYRIIGLAPGSYYACFETSSATGASTTGYLDQCYQDKPWNGSTWPTSGTATAISVTSGHDSTGINAVLVRGAAVSGTVTDASGPVSYAQVDVFDASGAERTATTDQSGNYTLSGLAAGTAFACFDGANAQGASAAGYLDQCYQGKPWDGSTPPDASTATPISLTAANTATGINATLAEAAGITGVVTDSSGPVSGVSVKLFDSSGNYVTEGYATDTTGSYRLTGFAPGSYFVCFDASQASGSAPAGYLDQCTNAQAWDGSTPPTSPPDTTVATTAGALTTVNATLVSAGGISGTVSDSSGPVSNVSIAVYTTTGTQMSAFATSDSTGAYTVTGLPSGSYFVCFNASAGTGSSAGGYFDQCYSGQSWDGSTAPASPPDSSVSVSSGSITPNINAALTAAGAISGTATDTVGPVSNVTVTVYDTGGVQQPFYAYTDQSGAYRLTGLSSGSYFVCFDASSATGSSAAGYEDQCYQGQSWDGSSAPAAPDTAVSVTDGQVTSGIDAALTAAGGVTGTIVDPSGAVSQASVQVYDSAGTFVNGTVTDSSGAYTLTGLVAGDFFVCVNGSTATGSSQAGYLDQCYDGQAWDGVSTPSAPPDTAVTVTAGNLATVNMTLVPATAITGTVSDASGAVSGVEVYAYDSSGNVVASVGTDASGTYTLSGLAAGGYFVCFNPASSTSPTDAAQCYSGQAWDGTSAPSNPPDNPVTTTAGQVTTSIDATLVAP